MGGLGKASHAVSWVDGLRERDSEGPARQSRGTEGVREGCLGAAGGQKKGRGRGAAGKLTDEGAKERKMPGHSHSSKDKILLLLANSRY